MTPNRTYKIIDHFKSGKCVEVVFDKSETSYEMLSLSQLFYYLRYELMNHKTCTFRLINKKGRRG